MPKDQKSDIFPIQSAASTQPNLPKIGYSIKETLWLLPVGRTTLYQLIRDGKLTALKINGRTMITTDSIKHFVASLPTLKTGIVAPPC